MLQAGHPNRWYCQALSCNKTVNPLDVTVKYLSSDEPAYPIHGATKALSSEGMEGLSRDHRNYRHSVTAKYLYLSQLVSEVVLTLNFL